MPGPLWYVSQHAFGGRERERERERDFYENRQGVVCSNSYSDTRLTAVLAGLAHGTTQNEFP